MATQECQRAILIANRLEDNLIRRVRLTHMDWKLHASRWVLGRLSGEKLPEIAVQALLEGDESPTLVLLAGESHPTAADAGPMFERVLHERGISLPDHYSAVMIVAADIARRVVNGSLEPQIAAQHLALLANELPSRPNPLWNFIGIESQMSDFGERAQISYYGEDYCAKAREKCAAEVVQACRELIKGAG